MYGIFTNIYPIYIPNVGKYTIHGAYGCRRKTVYQRHIALNLAMSGNCWEIRQIIPMMLVHLMRGTTLRLVHKLWRTGDIPTGGWFLYSFRICGYKPLTNLACHPNMLSLLILFCGKFNVSGAWCSIDFTWTRDYGTRPNSFDTYHSEGKTMDFRFTSDIPSQTIIFRKKHAGRMLSTTYLYPTGFLDS